MTRRAEIGASSVLGEMSGQVKQMVEQTQSQMSRTVGDVVQQLEREIEVAASSTAVMSGQATKIAVADVHRELQAQLDLNRVESQRRDADTRKQMVEIAANLATLTDQLNRFKPASVADVSGSRE